MQDISNGSKGRRGGSPPFQELERWIEDGAGGSHWVRVLSVDSEQRILAFQGDSAPDVSGVIVTWLTTVPEYQCSMV